MSRKRRHEKSATASCSGGAEAQIDSLKEEYLEDYCSSKKPVKRIKREILDEFEFLKDEEKAENFNCNGHSNMNGVENNPAKEECDDEEPEEFYVWLVQKPKNVGLNFKNICCVFRPVFFSDFRSFF